MFKLPSFSYESLINSKLFSDETIEFHVFQHHVAYIDKLNLLLEYKPELHTESLEEIILKSNGDIYNNAAQVWNHSFFWNSINVSKHMTTPSTAILIEINKSFKSPENFFAEFKKMATGNFGSGWTWLVKDIGNNQLSIVNTSNADVPFKANTNLVPLLNCDVWEHAYYIDYRNKRAKYVDNFLNNINWQWVEKCNNEKIVQPLGSK